MTRRAGAAGVTSFTDTFAPTGTDRYRVVALGATGTSTPTNVAEISIISTGEIFPRLSASVLSGTAPLTVAFDASCTNFARIATLTTSTTSYLDTTVSRGTAYRYRLVASNSSGAVTSNIVSVVARR